MASYRFVLRDFNKSDEVRKNIPTLLYLNVSDKGKVILKYPTGIKIAPTQWNENDNRVRKSNKDFDKHNKKISNLVALVENSFAEHLAANEVLKGLSVRTKLDEATNKVKKNLNHVLTYLESYIEKKINSLNPTYSEPYSTKTISGFNTLHREIANWQKTNRKILTFDKVDVTFYTDFVEQLQSIELAPATIGRYIKSLKAVLRDAELNGLKVNNSFRLRAFKAPTEETQSIYLNQNEITLLEKVNLIGTPSLERVRDKFLVGYHTGQRFSDFTEYTKGMFENERYLKLKQKKTKKYLEIDLVPQAIEILKKYDFDFKKIHIANSNFNEYIKEACKIAGIDSEVSRTIKRGKTEITEVFKKYELVSSHTARRSFCTNAYLNGHHIFDIMSVTGHSTELEFKKYIRMTSREKAAITKGLHLEKAKSFLHVA